MLIAARQARTANRFAPAQTRRTNAQAWLEGLYAPSICLWLDAYRLPQPVGTAVATAPDASGRSIAITQATASKQPIVAVNAGIKALQYDGVNDCLQTGTLTLGTQQVSIVAMSRQTSGTAILAEAGIGTPGTTDTVTHSRGDGTVRNIVGFYAGNVGLQYKLSTVGYADWVQSAIVCDKAEPAATEMLVFANNAAPALTVTTSNNTNTFGNYAWNIGSRNNGTVAPLLGFLSQVIVFCKALTAEERTQVYRSVQEICGLGWA